MSTIATALKQEIARVARKELKEEIAALRKLTTAHRSEIAALKREVKALQSAVRAVQKVQARPAPAMPALDLSAASEPGRRRQAGFSADQLRAYREQMGFTQAQMATLIGASSLSVYKWESGKVQPRAAQQVQIAAALKLGKRAAKARLEEQSE